jgi:hypothetical protein
VLERRFECKQDFLKIEHNSLGRRCEIFLDMHGEPHAVSATETTRTSHLSQQALVFVGCSLGLLFHFCEKNTTLNPVTPF